MMAGKDLVVPLAVAVLIAAAAAAVDDDDKSKPWKCFKPCTIRCHNGNADAAAAAAMDDFPPWDANVSAVTGECKNGCHDDGCYEDLPAISSSQCVVATCLSHPHHNRKIATCLKRCCDKCFRGGPSPPPGPSPPGPSPPGPPEPEPGPGPSPPSPPKPSWTWHG